MLSKTDRKFQIPRRWSNVELRRFAHLFDGDVVNVSGWKDRDKEGGEYKNYFTRKKTYTVTNYVSEAMGFQGKEGEIFLDLTADLPAELHQKFDTVFNHTVLEHIFEVNKAFDNLCAMSRDVVIVVVPFLQPMHAEYGDFWRFTPTCIQKMFARNGFSVVYSSFNDHANAGVYVFCIAARQPEKWKGRIPANIDENGVVPFMARPLINDGFAPMVGANSILNFGTFLGIQYGKLKKKLGLAGNNNTPPPEI